MQTERLYYQDSNLAQFSARVLACEAAGEQYKILLDRTAFYPEGGGQPGDIGTLGEGKVLDTRLEAGEIVHICTKPLAVGSTVEGKIDFSRRFDYMQQHSGEHIVSGLIHKYFGYENVGFHMGSDFVTIDLSGPLTMEDLAKIEREANEAVWKDLPIEITYLHEGDNAVPYRSKKALSGEIRLVTVPGYDTCACCGTHVHHTGEIGLIKIFSCQKFHDGVRVEMLCGRKAYEAVCALTEQNRQNSALLSAKPQETAQSVQRLLAELAQSKFRAGQLERRLVCSIIKETANEENVILFTDFSKEAIKLLADGLMQQHTGLCAVFSPAQEGYTYILAQKGADVRELAKRLNARLSGRGGGKAEFVSGSVRADRAEIEAFFAKEGCGCCKT